MHHKYIIIVEHPKIIPNFERNTNLKHKRSGKEVLVHHYLVILSDNKCINISKVCLQATSKVIKCD